MLRETEGRTGRYIALSHRWDSSAVECQTLRSNFTDRVSGECSLEPGFPHHISPLFHKICVLAWHLRVEFLWIDSLCITQDDAADWDREATKMARYYSSAWMTLAATVPIDIDNRPAGDLGGQLRIEDVSGVVRMPYHNKAGTQQGYFYAQAMGPHVLANLYKTQIAQSELLRRGWCFQEWLLSRRIVSFSRDTPFMQCRNDAPRCPASDTVEYSAMTRRPRRNFRLRAIRAATDENAGASEASATLSFKTKIAISPGPSQVTTTWMAVVESYSGLHLTKFEQDRFIALAGVAREFSIALKDELAADPGLHRSCHTDGPQRRRGTHPLASRHPPWPARCDCWVGFIGASGLRDSGQGGGGDGCVSGTAAGQGELRMGKSARVALGIPDVICSKSRGGRMGRLPRTCWSGQTIWTRGER